MSDNGFIPTLSIQDESKLSSLRMPAQGRNDFILASAGEAEFEVRCALLLWPGEESAPADIVTVDNMAINLATYQVYIDEEPVDLTLMEYSLQGGPPGRCPHRHRAWRGLPLQALGLRLRACELRRRREADYGRSRLGFSDSQK